MPAARCWFTTRNLYGSSGKLVCRNFEYLPGDPFLVAFLDGHASVNGCFLAMPLEGHIIASLNDFSRVRLWKSTSRVTVWFEKPPFSPTLVLQSFFLVEVSCCHKLLGLQV